MTTKKGNRNVKENANLNQNLNKCCDNGGQFGDGLHATTTEPIDSRPIKTPSLLQQ